MVREVLDLTRPLFERSPFTPNLEFLIAGWSAKNDRPECYVLATHNGAGLPAWELAPAMDGWLTHEELIQRLPRSSRWYWTSKPRATGRNGGRLR